ncbi:hypothetical protein PV334_33820 [Streptomyces sp. ME02-7008A-1]|uniref:hypothetical protein n=1 Tax=unclassified Streptomyces TaxID=2593676 RepID=UPI0029BA5DFE|nr:MULTISPECIES: hypothetical protein [unclassified Streptomyces]MDX3186217.1 hypothetical protein [Streptomyces sp. ME02-7008A-1]MDX3307334.1 hypothetical protein [Streptomyces sp. ME02-7008A]
MKDHFPRDEAKFESPAEMLQMPQQAPPVDRNASVPAAALGDNPAVQADGLFGLLDKILPF